MTAEEFFKKVNNGNTVTNKWIYDFAEAYHKHEVEAISNEDIQEKVENLEFSFGKATNEEKFGFLKGTNWFKNKLLKQ